jgi:hypothetical protein
MASRQNSNSEDADDIDSADEVIEVVPLSHCHRLGACHHKMKPRPPRWRRRAYKDVSRAEVL